jgi:galactose-1-phosphate uridylyltransferase
MEWVKTAKNLEFKEDFKKYREKETESKREEEILEAESNWLSRVMRMVQQVCDQGLFVSARQRGNQIELSRKGKVIVEFKEHQVFEVLFHDIQKPTRVSLRHPVNVRHHRLIRLRELDSNNIEEIVKFAALGINEYAKIAKYSRIERNLGAVLSMNKVDERI